ncbi:MAG: hypothetical protein ACRDZ0_05890 [Acidimicrobiales bacterium]
MLGSAVRRAWIAALAGAVAAAGACGGDDSDGESTNTTTASSTSAPTTTLDEETQKEEAATKAFLDYYEAFFTAAAEPVDPHLPELQRLMTGDQQRIVTRNLEDMRARGHATRLPQGSKRRHDPRVVEAQTDGSVDVTSCEVDDSVVYQVDTGAVVNDDVVTNVISATLVEERGQWKVTFSERTKTSPGIVECDI